jgi:excisionase family DNA binding protein
MSKTAAPLMTAQEVADALGLSALTILHWASDGRLPSLKLGRAVRFRPEDINAFLAGAYRPAALTLA